MKILMIFTSKFHYTGITNVVMNYYRELIKKEDISIDFCVPNEIEKELKDEIFINDSKVFVLPMTLRRKHTYKYIKKLTKVIKENKYDAVHIHGSSYLLALELYAAKKAGVNARIVHSHNTTTEHKFLHKLLKKPFLKYYTDAFACGNDAGKWLFKEREFYIVPNAQNVEKFSFNEELREKYREIYNLKDNIVIGHVGAFNYQKNHEFIIEIMLKLKENTKYKLILIGEGPNFENIKSKVYELNLQSSVIFVGKTTKVNEWLNAMDIMVLPSRFEGLPNVLIEWQISGLKSIVADTVTKEVAITDLIHFEKLDVDLWVEKIKNINIINHRRNHEKYIKNIVENNFEIRSSADRLYNKYVEIIKSRGN